MTSNNMNSEQSSAQLNRRRFMIGAGSLALGAVTPAAAQVGAEVAQQAAADTQAAAAAPPAKAPVKPGEGNYLKAVKYGMVRGASTVREKFQLVKDLGFDGIELNAPGGLKPEEVIEARDQTGLAVHGVVDSVHWKIPFSHPSAAMRKQGVNALLKALDDCKAYGGSSVLIVPGVVSKEVSYSQAWERSRAEIAKAVPKAEELGVQIAIENVWNNFLLSPLEMAQYIDSFQSKMVGAYLDVGNLVRFGWPEHWVEALGHRVFKVDVKGYSRDLQNKKGPWKGFDVAIGDGDCDWKSVMAALRAVGFEGWFTAEVGGGNRKHLAGIATAMDRIMSA
jgi:L-ribulose-5-phosphate 3-epimerase